MVCRSPPYLPAPIRMVTLGAGRCLSSSLRTHRYFQINVVGMHMHPGLFIKTKAEDMQHLPYTPKAPGHHRLSINGNLDMRTQHWGAQPPSTKWEQPAMRPWRQWQGGFWKPLAGCHGGTVNIFPTGALGQTPRKGRKVLRATVS